MGLPQQLSCREPQELQSIKWQDTGLREKGSVLRNRNTVLVLDAHLSSCCLC